MGPVWRPSPNFGPRRGGARPDLIVLHYTAMPLNAALDRLCDPAAEVSAHYLITREGGLFQLVDEGLRAWHAGAGSWGDVTDVNSRSIGIELDNSGAEPFPAPLMATLERLLAGLMVRWAVPPERVIAHSDMAPGRKCDPGRRFDWQRLARAGLSVWPEAGPGAGGGAAPDEAAFRAALVRVGYGPNRPTGDLLEAFRLRFRPWAAGPLCPADMAAALDLARRFPVDRRDASA
ncbi:N-acetylmuramoyl-L-alanine amidase [Rhodovulum euryhalinum]|uniref:N-acetylmuramoyl-L-alanine amidase n=1 Tax=Rhodovulum euryhalinum TaxID=35805 RepID=A0A4R2KHF2_9RHOB|nr:N-acetylmuramoyl-L-alanine amidase [Rhodovulum euryhalinum]TCO69906.1 N-acetylmuramoyl-L-alanine amidase [Rhodovulum euryhalinum]